MASHSVNPRDTQFLHTALHNWQERNHTVRNFLELSPAEQSEIMGDAQDLKQNAATELERATIQRFRRKLMRKFGIVAVMITVVASVAWGQTKAPSMTVFGLALGEPFTVPECSLFKLGRKDFVYAKNDKAVCFELNFVHHKSDPRSIPVTDGRFDHGSISIQTRTAIMSGAANLPKEPKL